MSNKQRLSISIVSKEEALSLIQERAEQSGPGLILTEQGKTSLTETINANTFDVADIVNKPGNLDVVKPTPVVEPEIKNNFQSRLRKSAHSLKNKSKIKPAGPKLK
ncbi:hypothetical protein [Serratia sp. Se-RSBMAAmG]|uniref:hypothetical protein n=1 Tax=Serratia sp. Se-RSBMAAmG TaxID=3043305 RepID=UPI0024AEA8D7|nr:hypothetical protein [Serratia sp. Se-RSBMAAmG]MDI6976637.1 hypothetical protein [Serratia sp. Se-RSBMAAmG]